MKAKIIAVALISCAAGAAGGVGYSRIVGNTSDAGAAPRAAPSSRYRAESAPVPVTVTKVEARDISATLQLTGNLLPRRRTILVSELDGVIDSIPNSRNNISFELDGSTVTQPLRLDIGQPVSKGDVLVQINRSEYELNLKAAQARLAKAERELQELIAWRRPEEIRKLEAAVAEAQAQLENTQSVLTRQESLVAENATSRESYDRAVAQAKLAQAAVDRAAAELDIAKKGPTQEQIEVARSAVAQAQADVDLRQDELRKATIVAPYDAVITDLRLSGSDTHEGADILSLIKDLRPRTKRILMTAYGNNKIHDEVLTMGAHLYLEKPVSIEALRKTLTRMFKNN